MTTAHEPRRGPDVHISDEDLSALAEGSQPGAESAAAHLLECPACHARAETLTELLAMFEEFGTPDLPQDVAIRIDAALARESEARTGEGAARPAVVPERTRRRGRGVNRGLGWALASLALIAGGLTLVLKLSPSGGTSPSTASGSAAMSPGVRTAGPRLDQGALGSPATLAPTSPLALWAKQMLAASATTKREANVAGAAACTSDPQFTGRTLLAVSSGGYEGVPAVLAVYANDGDASTVYAVVYATPCTESSHRVLGAGVVVR